MDTPIKTYYESKKRSLLYGIIVFVPLLLLIIREMFFSSNDIVFISIFIKLLILFGIIFGIFIYFYPIGVLEIYRDRFVYKKGRLSVSSSWSEINVIAFQILVGKYSYTGIPHTFFIETNKGSTKLIDTKILKQKGTNKVVDLVTFVQELESISGKVIKWGDTSIKKYSEVSFVDYLKGKGVVKV